MQAMMQNVYTYMASIMLNKLSGFNIKTKKTIVANCLTSLPVIISDNGDLTDDEDHQQYGQREIIAIVMQIFLMHSADYLTVCRHFDFRLIYDKYPRLAMEIFGDALPIEMPSNTSIHRVQGIVKQIDIRLFINRPRDIDSHFLATGQRYTSIADHCHVFLRKKLPEILRQGLAKQYIVPYSTIEKLGFLTGIGDTQMRIVCEVSIFISFKNKITKQFLEDTCYEFPAMSSLISCTLRSSMIKVLFNYREYFHEIKDYHKRHDPCNSVSRLHSNNLYLYLEENYITCVLDDEATPKPAAATTPEEIPAEIQVNGKTEIRKIPQSPPLPPPPLMLPPSHRQGKTRARGFADESLDSSKSEPRYCRSRYTRRVLSHGARGECGACMLEKDRARVLRVKKGWKN
ncbi:hypothetical protein G5I_09155 [Acromyrmex echinatior]|uniref:Uncharacterized protein n=1 Tax=Acromyrmex echinatior TaxID=103372 RepID=F4WTF7_ACREC|nr:hypothetical protein G5I_09155 [Acromyrmex echinatior]